MTERSYPILPPCRMGWSRSSSPDAETCRISRLALAASTALLFAVVAVTAGCDRFVTTRGVVYGRRTAIAEQRSSATLLPSRDAASESTPAASGDAGTAEELHLTREDLYTEDVWTEFHSGGKPEMLLHPSAKAPPLPSEDLVPLEGARISLRFGRCHSLAKPKSSFWFWNQHRPRETGAHATFAAIDLIPYLGKSFAVLRVEADGYESVTSECVEAQGEMGWLVVLVPSRPAS